MYRPAQAAAAVLTLTVGLIFGGASAAHAAVVTFTDGAFTYRVDDADGSAGATITDLDFTASRDLTIPSTVTSLGVTYDVTTIGEEAFSYDGLTSVTIPNSVTTIGEEAFLDNLLTSVTIPNSVTTIGDSAFGVNLLTSVTIPNSVTTMGDYAFYNNRLTSVTIPNSVTTIGEEVFYTNLLTSVTIPNSVTTIGDYAFYNNRLTSVTIPNSVTTIGVEAFGNNPSAWFFVPASVTNTVVAPLCASNARTVTFDSAGGSELSRAIACSALAVPTPVAPTRAGFTLTGWSAQQSGGALYDFSSQVTANTTLFAQWTADSAPPGTVTGTDNGFTFTADSANPAGGATVIAYSGSGGAIAIPSTFTFGGVTYPVTAIGTSSFRLMGLTSVVIPNTVTTIGVAAFEDNALTEVTISNRVTTIGNSAFANNALTSVVIPNSVTAIGDSAFTDNALTSVVIPNSVTAIGAFAFTDNALTSVTIGNSVVAIGSAAFRNNALTSVVIPNSVITIGPDAFRANDLMSVVIPDSVITIGEFAFTDNALASVTIGNNVITIGLDAFLNNPLAWFLVPVSVPDSVVAPLCTPASDARAVTFDSAGGSAVSRAIACSDLAVPAPVAPTRAGFTLTGWSAQQSGGALYDFSSQVTANTTLFAQWTVVPAVAAPSAPGGLAATGASLPLVVPMGMAMLLLTAGGCVLLASRRRVGQRA
jgi:uncharacterized repeat protein (TIGR02543 family)